MAKLKLPRLRLASTLYLSTLFGSLGAPSMGRIASAGIHSLTSHSTPAFVTKLQMKSRSHPKADDVSFSLSSRNHLISIVRYNINQKPIEVAKLDFDFWLGSHDCHSIH